MAKRKRETSGGKDGHQFDFYKDHKDSSAVMSDPRYQKNAIQENMPMFATLWVKCFRQFGPGCIVVDFLSMTPEDELGDEIQYGMTYAPKKEALEACNNHPGLVKMFVENNPDYKIIFFFFHPEGHSFYQVGMDPRSGYTLENFYLNNRNLIDEFEPNDEMMKHWVAKLEALAEIGEDDVSDPDDKGG